MDEFFKFRIKENGIVRIVEQFHVGLNPVRNVCVRKQFPGEKFLKLTRMMVCRNLKELKQIDDLVIPPVANI